MTPTASRSGGSRPTAPSALARRLLSVSTVLLLGAAPVIGCSNTVHGSASKHTTTVATGRLEPGNYPTKPRPALGDAGAARGALVEARRMGNAIAHPFDVDSVLTGAGYGAAEGPLNPLGDALGHFFGIRFPEGADRGYICQFWSSRYRVPDGTPQVNFALVRYRTPEDAAAAAATLGTEGGPNPGLPQYADRTPTASQAGVPRHPEAHALSWGPANETTVVSYTARGPLLVAQHAYGTGGADDLLNLVATALDRQIRLIDEFKPTPADQLAQLPLDPDGLLARTLEPAPDDRVMLLNGLYDVRGFLTFSDAPAADEKLLNEAGVSTIAVSGADVYRARDGAGADQIVAGWAAVREKDSDTIAAVPGLPGSRCFSKVTGAESDYPQQSYNCLFSAGRDAVDVSSGQKNALYQKAAAQYLMLTAP